MEAAIYDAWYDSSRGRWTGEVEYALLRQLLLPEAGERLLDVGCGTGWFTRRLAGDGCLVTGLDRNAEWLGYARKRSTGVDYVQGDALALPFADAGFDHVVSVAALCFVADWTGAMREIVRVSRKRFAIGLLHRHSLLYWHKGRHGGGGAYRGAHWHTRQEVQAAMAYLPVSDLRFSYAVMLPSGSRMARLVEQCLPDNWPLGSFMVVSGTSQARAG